jgi:DNA-directed RNA polymerase omega subunit
MNISKIRRKLGKVSIDELKNKIGNKYILTILASKRAKHIKSRINADKYMRICKWPKPLLETDSKKPLTIALKEIAKGKIYYKESEKEEKEQEEESK